jgi:tetratricopeptide (TPR) repeat protein
VTVAGPGGSGKTRLAGEVARRAAGRFADGAWLVELALMADPDQMAAVVAAELGVRDLPGVSPAEALVRTLARRQLLLVLDNCEHVIGAAAELCAGLLAACDDVTILATSQEPLAVAGEAAGRAEPGSEAWCAAQYWLGRIAFNASDLAGALGHFTVVRDAIGDGGPSRALAACLAGRSGALSNPGKLAEAAAEARRSLVLAREIGDPAGEALALIYLAVASYYGGDIDDALQLARQARQIPAGIPDWVARACSMLLADMLNEAGDLAAAERIYADELARSREVGDLGALPEQLASMADVDLQAGRVEDAAERLHEALWIISRTGDRFELFNVLDGCAHLCAATGRRAEEVTVWAACFALLRREGSLMDTAWNARRREALREARHTCSPAVGADAASQPPRASADAAPCPGGLPPAADACRDTPVTDSISQLTQRPGAQQALGSLRPRMDRPRPDQT